MDFNVKKKILGIAFADEMEYAPFLTYAQQQGFQAEEKRGNAGLVMELQEGDRQLEIHAVQCGIGKVHPASAVSLFNCR